MTDYLTVAEVLQLHRLLIARYGGAFGVRDLNALESALYRPQSGYYVDIIQEACALMESIAINHPFIDGNKRVAFAVTDVFLRLNGFRIFAPPMGIYRNIIGLFDHQQFTLEGVEGVLRQIIRSTIDQVFSP